jgi:hypothetical protein
MRDLHRQRTVAKQVIVIRDKILVHCYLKNDASKVRTVDDKLYRIRAALLKLERRNKPSFVQHHIRNVVADIGVAKGGAVMLEILSHQRWYRDGSYNLSNPQMDLIQATLAPGWHPLASVKHSWHARKKVAEHRAPNGDDNDRLDEYQKSTVARRTGDNSHRRYYRNLCPSL